MLDTIQKEFPAKISILIFTLFTLWWVFLEFILKNPESTNNLLFSGTYGVMALLGGIVGMKSSFRWGGYKSVLGRSIFMFALGLLLQEFGQIAYSVYYQFHIEVPYPSLGDVGYFLSIPCYIYGVILLARASGVRIHLNSFLQKIQALLIPLGMLILGYYFFLRGYEFDWTKPLVIFLDFGYPMGEAIYISLAIVTYLLSRNVLGGIMRSKILFILFALVVQFLADYLFLYQSHQGAFYPAGISDYLYLVSYLFMTLALIQLNSVAKTLK